MATHTADLYRRCMFPLIVFTGANAPSTVSRFPRGEAVHYREHALSLGVPDDAILVERYARSTITNINNTRDLLAQSGVQVESVTLISRPYQQRRAYGICRRIWPEVDVICSAQAIDFSSYLDAIGDTDLVIHTMVGDTQRLALDVTPGVPLELSVPERVYTAYLRLVDGGYTHRIVHRASPAD